MEDIASAEIIYKINTPLEVEDIIDVFISSGIKRPVENRKRITGMFTNSNLVISAWHGEKLVGISRAFTDFAFSCYLCDLAVRKEYQHIGIGKTLISLTKEKAGKQSNLILLSAPAAINYYSKIGLEKADNAFLIKRES